MPSDSVSSFLDLARTHRLVGPDAFDDLFRSPDVPQENVGALCEALHARGMLTRFQADAVRSGRRDELTFAGYPVADELGPCPGGIAYRAIHPSLRSPLVLRRLRADWIGPADSVAAFAQRAREAAPVVHPRLAHMLDAGVQGDEAFAVLDPVEGGDLFALVNDIGPMPTPLATTYIHQLASALKAAHEKGLVHGDVRPGVVFAGPLVPMGKHRADGSEKLRPAGNAAITLTELGLVPHRPPVAAWPALGVPITADAAFLPPERLDAGEPTAAGDVYGIGAAAYFLLTGRPPVQAVEPSRLLDKLRNASPHPLSAYRPDVPKELVELVESMLSRDPAKRPTAAAVAVRLSPGARPLAGEPVVPLAPAPEDPTPTPAADNAGWAGFPVSDEPSEPAGPSFHDDSEPAQPAAPKPVEPADRKKLYLWIGVGLGLQLLAVAGWILFATQPSWLTGDSPKPAPAKPTPAKKAGGRG